jgi:hypothetical protein
MCEKYHNSSTPKETTFEAKPFLGSMHISLDLPLHHDFYPPTIYIAQYDFAKKYLSTYRLSRNVRKYLVSDFLAKHYIK